MKESVLTCHTRGKFLKLARMRMMQRSFQIEEDPRVFETSSFPGRVSSESGITVCYYAKLRPNTRVVFAECGFLN